MRLYCNDVGSSANLEQKVNSAAVVSFFYKIFKQSTMTISGHTPYTGMTKAELIDEIIRLNKEISMLKKRLALYKEIK